MFDFPTNPASGTVVMVPDGSYRVWDSTKWRASPSSSTITTGPFLPIAGGVMTGALSLAGNATSALHAVPLQQLTAATAGGPFLPISYAATGTPTARSAYDRAAEVINVKDFGAKGDGFTDDTAAIQAALNAITTNGAAVYFPGGAYVISATLIVPTTGLSASAEQSGIRLFGDGRGITRFVTNMTAAPFITCTMPTGSSMFNLTIEGMLFQPNSGSYNSWHIVTQNIHGVTLRGCDLWSQNSSASAIAGVRVCGEPSASAIYARIEHCSLIGATVEFSSVTDSWIQDSILQCIIASGAGARTSSIHLTGATCGDIKITNNHIYSATSGGIFCDVAGSAIMTVEGNMFDTNPPNPMTAIAINITNGGKLWTIVNNLFNAIPATTIACYDLHSSTIANNMFIECGIGSASAATITFNAVSTGCQSVIVSSNGARIDNTLSTPLWFVQENRYGANNNVYLANSVLGSGYQAAIYQLDSGSTPNLHLPAGIIAGGAQLSGGLGFGSAQTSDPLDLSRHIDLFAGNLVGFSVAGGNLNYVSPAGHNFYSGGVFTAFVNSVGLALVPGKSLIPNLISAANDAAAATSGVPVGALYHNGNAVQVRLT